MNNVAILVVALIVVVAIVAVAALAMQRRRSDELRRRFGPEYERTVDSSKDRRAAEAELREREQRIDALQIRPLDAAARDRFAERWREVQAMFVDDPGNAVEQADSLIGEVMRARGYPVGDFEQRAADISVNHPHVVDHYRTAHAIALKRRSGEGATEQLRQAFVHYRALFADLLETRDAAETSDAEARVAAREAAPETVAEAEAAETSAGQRSRLASRPASAAPADRPTRESPAAVDTEEPVDPARRTR